MTPRPDASGGGRPTGQPGARSAPGAGSDSPKSAERSEADSIPVPGNGENGTGLSENDEAKVVEEDLDTVLAVARRERDEYLDMLRRVQADFENYKKRMIRQQTELLERAAQGLVEKLLPALDAFDLARAHLADSHVLSDEGKALLQASALLFDSLSKEGLERVDDTGAAFDPMTHDAVEHDTSEAPAAHGTEETESAEGTAGAGTEGAGTAGAGSAGAGGGPEEAARAEAQSGPTVVSVLRPGYRWKGRVIRPAMVKVRG